MSKFNMIKQRGFMHATMLLFAGFMGTITTASIISIAVISMVTMIAALGVLVNTYLQLRGYKTWAG